MAYGIVVNSSNGSNQLNSENDDEGLTVTYSGGNAGVNFISRNYFNPDRGDLLLLGRGANDLNAYTFIEYNPFRFGYDFKIYDGGMSPDITSDGSTTWCVYRVARTQSAAAVSGSYGLEIKQPNQSLGFDSRAFGDKGFNFNKIYYSQQITPSSTYRQGVQISTSFEWVVANNITRVRAGSTARGEGVRLGIAGGGISGIWYYRGFAIPGGGGFTGISSQNITNSSDVILAREF